MSTPTTKPMTQAAEPTGQPSAVIAKFPVLRSAGFASTVPTVPQSRGMSQNRESDKATLDEANAAAANGRTSARIHTPFTRAELEANPRDGIDPLPQSSATKVYNERRSSATQQAFVVSGRR